MNLLDFALITLYALGLRQLLFEYKKTRFIRDFLLNTPFAELTKCVYCQAIECIAFVLMTKQYIEPVFIALAVGFVAIALDAWIYQAIANMEKLRESNHEDQSKKERATEDSPNQE
jgi:type III secretory pathway component EscU